MSDRPGVEKGVDWEAPSLSGGRLVEGSDADLARAARDAGPNGPALRFRPAGASDFARTVGLSPSTPAPGPGHRFAVDLLVVDTGTAETVAVNAVAVGVPLRRLRRYSRATPVSVTLDGVEVGVERATGIVVANGEFLDGDDVVPRAHPGDGMLDLHVYAVPGRERRELRTRLRTGSHLPHPQITQRRGRRVDVRFSRAVPLEVDGVRLADTSRVSVRVEPSAFMLDTGGGDG